MTIKRKLSVIVLVLSMLIGFVQSQSAFAFPAVKPIEITSFRLVSPRGIAHLPPTSLEMNIMVRNGIRSDPHLTVPEPGASFPDHEHYVRVANIAPEEFNVDSNQTDRLTIRLSFDLRVYTPYRICHEVAENADDHNCRSYPVNHVPGGGSIEVDVRFVCIETDQCPELRAYNINELAAAAVRFIADGPNNAIRVDDPASGCPNPKLCDQNSN